MIPYTIERRADTGVNNATLGIWLFIASEVMLFGALFSAYAMLRIASADWPSGLTVLNLQFGLASTLVLVVMTVVMWQARRAPIASASRSLLVAIGLAVVFLAIKSVEYSREIERGLVPSVSTFLATYFTLTGLHALHVVGGLVANLWTLTGARQVAEGITRNRLQSLALYWAFVDVVWLIILVTMYVA